MTAVRNVAAESGYYRPQECKADSDWLEERLSKIEEYAAPAIDKLISSNNWESHTEEDRITLAVFLITLYTRGPRVRRSLTGLPAQVLEHFDQIGEEIAPELRKQLEDAQDSDPVPSHGGVIIETAKNYAALLERSWWLLIPPIGSRFICSDCPVLIDNPIPAGLEGNLGLLSKGVVLYLPISPHLMLRVADSVHGAPDRHVRNIGPEEFLHVQHLTGFSTERFLYGRASEDLVIPDGSWVGGRRPEIVSPAPKS